MNTIRISFAILIIVILAFIIISPPIPFLLKNEQKPQDTEQIPNLYSYPVKTANFQNPPEITAKSAVVIDAKTGVTLFEKDPNIHHLPASTTKLMTALVALEKCSPEKQVQIGYVEREPNSMGLETGDTLTVQNLLYGLLIPSGNDAAFALAYTCSSSIEEFVKEMNQKAKELQMQNTNFANPAGFDNPAQYTTARDLAKLSKVAVANPLIAKIVATKQTTVTDVYGQKVYYLQNVNELLGELEGVVGVKTGQTAGSLQVLITQTTRNDNTIISVVLGSIDRTLESKQLIEWAFANHNWIKP